MNLEEFRERLGLVGQNPDYETFKDLIEEVVLNEVDELEADELDENGVLVNMFGELSQASTNPDLDNPDSELTRKMTEVARILFLVTDLNSEYDEYEFKDGEVMNKQDYLIFEGLEIETFTQAHLEAVNKLKNFLALGSEARKEMDSFSENILEIIPPAIVAPVDAAPALNADMARGGSPNNL